MKDNRTDEQKKIDYVVDDHMRFIYRLSRLFEKENPYYVGTFSAEKRLQGIRWYCLDTMCPFRKTGDRTCPPETRERCMFGKECTPTGLE